MADFPFPNNEHRLTGQVAVVTGASSGLGWHFARVLASVGATVAITGRRESRLLELKTIIEKDGGKCESYVMDMMDADEILAVTEKIENELGSISILVNNAGVPDAQLAMKMSVELIDKVLGTNLRGPFILSCDVAKRMKRNSIHGRIVNISSIAAFHYDGLGAALYSTSKAAVVRMTETLAVEWARFHINVNAIAPGSFSSEMMDGMVDRLGEFYKGFPRKRLGHPSQLDTTLLFLCSPASECVTGTVIRVDDGQMPR